MRMATRPGELALVLGEGVSLLRFLEKQPQEPLDLLERWVLLDQNLGWARYGLVEARADLRAAAIPA